MGLAVHWILSPVRICLIEIGSSLSAKYVTKLTKKHSNYGIKA